MLDAGFERCVSEVLSLLNLKIIIHFLPVVGHCEDGISALESSKHALLGTDISLYFGINLSEFSEPLPNCGIQSVIVEA